MSEAPERIWAAHGWNRRWNHEPWVRHTKGFTQTEYVRADLAALSPSTEALREALVRAEAVMGRVLADTYWRTPDNTLWPDLCEARKEARAALAQLAPEGSTGLVRKAAQQVHRIKADLADFDGDRRGHYAALEDAESRLIKAALAAFPAAPEGRESGEPDQ